jgi:spermidine/putrescine transport system ATP-binding protein
MSADVDIDRVTIRFGGFVAVNDVSLHIAGGEFFSILGPSGCGKTTILRAVSGFLAPSGGKVRIGGRDMAGVGPNKRPTALIFQNLALFPLMSVADNIGYGLRVRGVSAKLRRRKVDELLALVALAGAGDKRIAELSGGQKQRVAIARALYHDPPILIFDEATSALDTESERAIQDNMARLLAGRTCLVIAHRLSTIRDADSIIVMERGRVAEMGNHDQLMAQRGLYFYLSSQQLGL